MARPAAAAGAAGVGLGLRRSCAPALAVCWRGCLCPSQLFLKCLPCSVAVGLVRVLVGGVCYCCCRQVALYDGMWVLCRTALQYRYCRYDGVHVQRTGGRGDGCATLW